jgi:hypothetical protein
MRIARRDFQRRTISWPLFNIPLGSLPESMAKRFICSPIKCERFYFHGTVGGERGWAEDPSKNEVRIVSRLGARFMVSSPLKQSQLAWPDVFS